MKQTFKDFFKMPQDITYDPDELKKGVEIEKEHTTDADIAEIIAKHHLAEDPQYYTKLASLNL